MKLTVQAAAKINLMLDILYRRTDGYHDLCTVMQSVSVYDTVTLEETWDGAITLTCSEPDLPADGSNIAWKAAESFFRAARMDNPGIRIHIEKRIPFAAGLAGGSADGAAVLVGLNALLGRDLSREALCAAGVKVGADVPFCITGGTVLCQGIGDILSPLGHLPHCHILLAKPEAGVNTARAYEEFDLHGKHHTPDKLGLVQAIQAGDLPGVAKHTANVFEEFIEVPDRVELKKRMYDCGALGACMSGSGPTVFGIFETQDAANAAAEAVRPLVRDALVCRPVTAGCNVV